LILLLLVVVLEVVNCDDGNDDSDEKKINGKNFEWGQFDKIPILCHDCPENRTFVLVTSEKICFKISKMPTDTYLSYLDFRPAGVNFSISIIHFEKKNKYFKLAFKLLQKRSMYNDLQFHNNWIFIC